MAYKKYIFLLLFAFSICIAIFSLISCKSPEVTRGGTSAEDIFNKAMAYYKDEDYYEAQKYFDILKLQYPASIYTDDAQFYLAEINFKKGEFVLAAYNYNYLRRAYPHSEFFKEAMFKTALSYYELSPTYDRDQEYTYKAIQAFAEFQAFFPQDSLSKIANERIVELRDKLGHREYFTAELYRKLYSPKSALVYYDSVIEDFPDTKYFELAYVGKIEVLYELFRYDEALGIIKIFKQLFPKSSNLSKINSIESAILK